MDIEKKVIRGIGVLALVGAMTVGTGFCLKSPSETAVKKTDDKTIEESENTTRIYDILGNSTKIEVIDTDFIIPERIEHEDIDSISIRVPKEYELYSIEYRKNGVISVDRSDPDYIYFNGFDSESAGGYIGIKPELKNLISASKSLNAELIRGNLDVLNAKKLEVSDRKAVVPIGYTLYDLDNDEEKKEMLSFLEKTATKEGIEYQIPDESILYHIIVLPSEYAMLLESARDLQKEAQEFYDGYNAKSIG